VADSGQQTAVHSHRGSHRGSHRAEHVLAAILGITGGLVAISLAIAILDPQGFFGFVFAVPGRFLFSSLHMAAWWVPVYLWILAIFSGRSAPLTWPTVVLVNLVHIPVLTIAAILRLLTLQGEANAPFLALLTGSFTHRGAMLVLSLVLALESVGLLQIWRLFEARVKREDAPPDRLRLPAPAQREGPRADFSDGAASVDDDLETDGLMGSDASMEADAPRGPAALWEPDASLEPDMPPEDVTPPGTDRQNRSMADELRESLAALRRRMEEGLDDEVPVDGPEQTEHPVPPELSEGQRLSLPERPERLERVGVLVSDDAPEGELTPEAPLPLYFHRNHEPDEEDDEEVIGQWMEPDDIFEEDDDEEDDDEGELFAEDDQLEPAAPGPVKRPVQTGRRYALPIDGILRQYSDGRYWEIDDGTRDAGEVLRITLEEFGIKAEVTGIRKGPVITMFEILPAPGVKLAKITNLADNIALRLAASSVRIVAPIPGKHAVGIEIPNKERNIVSFGELLRDDEFFGDRFDIPIALGKDIAGEAQIVDLARTPHLLIAGATGSGKSVCVNSIICSVLYRQTPAQVKLILIDPKIVELKFYNDIPHLLTPVITDPKRAFQALQYLIYEMERRYSLLDSLGARDISGYNAKIKRKNLATEPLPYIVVIIDEFADLMATSGKELESTVARLAAMSRAVGIHIVLATQRPSTDVITGLIKANIPSRIAFMVASKVDSRIIIDTQGAEKLLGRGDMLFTSSSDPFPVRIQGAFLSEDEVERVVEEVKTFGEPDYIDDEIFIEEDDDDIESDVLEDPLMEKAIEVVTTSRKASASYIQRRLKVGYNRAARMVEEMERMGIVGPQNGSKPRDVIG
jgi:DNA segregation ATPase FtsK/SpoIIIE, S-DNA-T family